MWCADLIMGLCCFALTGMKLSLLLLLFLTANCKQIAKAVKTTVYHTLKKNTQHNVIIAYSIFGPILSAQYAGTLHFSILLLHTVSTYTLEILSI